MVVALIRASYKLCVQSTRGGVRGWFCDAPLVAMVTHGWPRVQDGNNAKGFLYGKFRT